jgi:hypothetical protein
VITRRLFVGGLAGVCMAREQLVLEAIAAEKMPHRIVVRGVARSPFFEVRDYGSAAEQVIPVLNRCRIRAVLEENGRFLFSFESLEARERAWRLVSADAEWVGLRKSVELQEIAVYRVKDISLGEPRG